MRGWLVIVTIANRPGFLVKCGTSSADPMFAGNNCTALAASAVGVQSGITLIANVA